MIPYSAVIISLPSQAACCQHEIRRIEAAGRIQEQTVQARRRGDVVEKKDLHLKNEDTGYKWKLFETLERNIDDSVTGGELTLEDKTGPMRFRLLLDGDWKSQVDAALSR